MLRDGMATLATRAASPPSVVILPVIVTDPPCATAAAGKSAKAPPSAAHRTTRRTRLPFIRPLTVKDRIADAMIASPQRFRHRRICAAVESANVERPVTFGKQKTDTSLTLT